MDQLRLFNEPQREYTSDDYWTPKWVFDTLGIEFDLDVACPPEGPAHTPCKRFYTQADDGLTSLWYGNVWMNPPFSNTTPWAHKFAKHGNGIALLPFAKSKWCVEIWNAAPAIVMLPSSFKFDEKSISIHTFLCAFGDANIKALANIGRVR